MYITGTQVDFNSRMHQLTISSNDLATGFLVEGNGYLVNAFNSGSGVINPYILNISGKWDREARLKQYQFSSTGLNQPQFVALPYLFINWIPAYGDTYIVSGVNTAIMSLATEGFTSTIAVTNVQRGTVSSGNTIGCTGTYNVSVIQDTVFGNDLYVGVATGLFLGIPRPFLDLRDYGMVEKAVSDGNLGPRSNQKDRKFLFFGNGRGGTLRYPPSVV
jgi:hypothetical protein